MSASGSQHSIGMEAEATYGVPPVAPAWDPILHNGGVSGGLEKDTYQDETISTNRCVQSLRHGARKSGLSIPFTARYDAVNQEILEAVLCGTWTTNVVKVGSTRRSFGIEEKFADFDVGAKLYQRHEGCDWNTYGLNITTGGNITGTCSFVAQDKSYDTAIIASATYPAAATTEPFSGFDITLEVNSVAVLIATELSFNIDNQMAGEAVLGSDLRTRPPIGKALITGSLTTQLNNSTLEELFAVETSFNIEAVLTDPAGNTLTWAFNKCKFTGAAPSIPNDLGMTIALPWTAEYYSSDASSIVVTRAPAV